MTSYLISPVQPGDALPFLFGLATDGRFLSRQMGRPAAVLLIGTDGASCRGAVIRRDAAERQGLACSTGAVPT